MLKMWIWKNMFPLGFEFWNGALEETLKMSTGTPLLKCPSFHTKLEVDLHFRNKPEKKTHDSPRIWTGWWHQPMHRDRHTLISLAPWLLSSLDSQGSLWQRHTATMGFTNKCPDRGRDP